MIDSALCALNPAGQVKWAFTTRRVNRADVAGMAQDYAAAKAGDLVLGRVERRRSHRNIQLSVGRASRLHQGDLVMLARGARCADAGAALTLDFTDCGMVSTYREPLARIVAALDTMLARAAAQDCGAAVVEIADGLPQDETAASLRDPAARARIDGWPYACPDALSAAGGLTTPSGLGLTPLAVTGLITWAPLAVEEAERQTGATALSREALRDPAEATAVQHAARAFARSAA